MTQTEKMLNTPVNKLVASLAIPAIISMLVTNIYNLVDTAFIGTLGTSASGAVGVVFGYMAIIQAIGFMFGQGSGIMMSRNLGDGKNDVGNMYASTGVFASTLIGVIFAVITAIWMDPIIKFLGSTPTIAPYAKEYIRYILIAAPAMTASFALNNILRFEGRAKLGMIGLISGAALNILGDAVFIFKFDMGITGAGLSTCISQYIGVLILALPFIRRKTIVTLNPKFASLKLSVYREVAGIGFPSLIRQGLTSIATIILNNLAGQYSDAAVAAMSISTRISFLAFGVALGIGQGFQPVSSFSFGAKKFRRLRDSLAFTMVTAETVLCCLLSVIFIFAPKLIWMFRHDMAVVEIGQTALRYLVASMALLAASSLCEMLFQTTGKSGYASILAALRNGLIFIPALIIFESLWGLKGIIIAQPVAYVLTYIPSFILLYRYLKYELPKEDL